MFRIGQGFDVHQLAENRPLIIGGIKIPYEKGLLGHSDADVLLHTVADACLRCNWRRRYWNTFSRYQIRHLKMPIQRKLLEHVWNLVKEQAIRISQC